MAIAFEIHRFDTLASTNSTARRWASEGLPEGTVVVAARQTAGRGRQGRTWTSLPGALLFSILLRPQFEPQHLTRLGFYACVAAAAAGEDVGVADSGIKWPNDLVLPSGSSDGTIPGWAKWGGVLIETGTASDGLWAVVGVGLNVGSPAQALPAAPPGAASLSSFVGWAVGVEDVLRAYLSRFGALYGDGRGGDWKGALDAWRRRDIVLGRRIRAEHQGLPLEGTAAGIDERGALEVRTPRGPVWVEAGDVHLISTGM